MIKKEIFTAEGLWKTGSIILRVMAGLTISKFGLEVFAEDKMNGFEDWLRDLHFPAPAAMAYTGKVCELVGGILLAIGLFTRVAAISLVITTFIISFIMSKAQLLSADSSLLLMLIFLHFLLTGPGKWSLDYVFFKPKE